MATVAWAVGRKKTLTIANGQTETDVLDLGAYPTPRSGKTGAKAYRDLNITIQGPATLGGTVTVQVCDTEAGTYTALQSGGADVTVPAAKTTPVVPISSRFMKLVSSGAESGGKNFIVTGHIRR